MKQIKAKYYPETKKIVPIEQKLPLIGEEPEKIPCKGTDEEGDYIVIDFVTEDKPTFFDYDITDQVDEDGVLINRLVTTKIIGEEEWDNL